MNNNVEQYVSNYLNLGLMRNRFFFKICPIFLVLPFAFLGVISVTRIISLRFVFATTQYHKGSEHSSEFLHLFCSTLLFQFKKVVQLIQNGNKLRIVTPYRLHVYLRVNPVRNCCCLRPKNSRRLQVQAFRRVSNR